MHLPERLLMLVVKFWTVLILHHFSGAKEATATTLFQTTCDCNGVPTDFGTLLQPSGQLSARCNTSGFQVANGTSVGIAATPEFTHTLVIAANRASIAVEGVAADRQLMNATARTTAHRSIGIGRIAVTLVGLAVTLRIPNAKRLVAKQLDVDSVVKERVTRHPHRF